MVMTEPSMEELDKRMATGADVRAFRPSLYVAGNEPFEENSWEFLKVNDAVFRSVMVCARCPVVDNDPDRGEKRSERHLPVLRT
jgi:hypothetical protein